ncbi:MAG: serine hydrolase domain-containing protein [Aristaeellaceae bacterium]
MNRQLYEAIGFFTEKTRIMPCLSVTCGTADSTEYALRGVMNRQGDALTEDALYDLASLTKLFTGLLVMRLYEDSLLDLSAPVTRYAPQFRHLSQVSVDSVLGFETGLSTPQRLDTQPTADAARAQLWAITPQTVTGRHYSDMHAMVLKYVVEGAAGQDYAALVKEKILQPLGMEDTFCCVPEGERHRCIAYSGEHRMERGRYILRESIPLGTPHDPKAQLLWPESCGHAGMFATRGDMVKLCQGLLRGQVIRRESIERMARNRTGRRLSEGVYTQYLGSQCYVKHPQQYYSEIPVYMSDKAIGLSGFTGHHLAVDVERGIFTLFLGNRVLDRLTVLLPENGRSITDEGLNPDGTGQVRWPDGRWVTSSVNYVHQKDEHLHRVIMDVLGLERWHRAGSEWP